MHALLASTRCLTRALFLAALLAPSAAVAQQNDTQGSSGSGTGSSAASQEPVDLDAGGELGYARLEGTNYVAPTLAADLRLEVLQAAVRIPLRFDSASGDIRDKDWDEPGDFFRLGQCLRLDWHSEGTFSREKGLCLPWEVNPDDYYLSLRMGPIVDTGLAHGTILGAYSNNLNPDHFHSGVISQAQLHQFVHARILLDNLTNPSLLAGVVQLLPFAYELPQTRQWYAESSHLHIQLTAVSDLQAPNQVLTAFGRPLSDGAGNLLFTTAPVTVVGGNLEYVYAFGSQIKAEAHADWNWITGHGMGGHGQVWFVYNHPEGSYTVRAQGEFRFVQRNYIPTYFDSYYEIARQQVALVDEARDDLEAGGAFLTKRQSLTLLDGDDAWDPGIQGGFEFEAFKVASGERRRIFFARGFFGNTFGRTGDGQFVLSAEAPRLADKIDLYALFSRQGFDEIGDLFTLQDTLVKVLVRWDLTERFYVLLNYARVWQLRATPDQGGFQSGNAFTASLGIAEELQ